MTVRGPETKATSLPVTIVGTEFFGIRFKVGTVLPYLPASTLIDEDVNLPDASSKSFWLNGSAWQFPNYENAETFVESAHTSGFAGARSSCGSHITRSTKGSVHSDCTSSFPADDWIDAKNYSPN